MSNLIVTNARMHKIANVFVDVKYRHPGNVVAYISVEFEIFSDGESFQIMPLVSEENKRIVNMPTQFSFQFKNGRICVCEPRLEVVVEEIVNELANQDIIKMAKKKMMNSAEVLEF
jgi:hypothetical protein